MMETDHIKNQGKFISILPFGISLFLLAFGLGEDSLVAFFFAILFSILGCACLSYRSEVLIDKNQKKIVRSAIIPGKRWTQTEPLSNYRKIVILEIDETGEDVNRRIQTYVVTLVHKFEKSEQLYGTGCLNMRVRGFKEDIKSASEFASYLSEAIGITAEIKVYA